MFWQGGVLSLTPDYLCSLNWLLTLPWDRTEVFCVFPLGFCAAYAANWVTQYTINTLQIHRLEKIDNLLEHEKRLEHLKKTLVIFILTVA